MATQETARNVATLQTPSPTMTIYRCMQHYSYSPANAQSIRVFSIDSNPLVQCGISTLIESQPDMLLAGQAFSGREAVERFNECTPDVTLMDLQLPDMHSVTAMSSIMSQSPQARFVVLSEASGDVEIQRVLEAGAHGCVLKNMPADELLASIRQVHAGKKRIPPAVAALLAEHYGDTMLTTREVEVLNYVLGGHRNRDIAEQLFVTVETVKAHIKHILDKLGAIDRTHAVAIGLRRGIIQL